MRNAGISISREDWTSLFHSMFFIQNEDWIVFGDGGPPPKGFIRSVE